MPDSHLLPTTQATHEAGFDDSPLGLLLDALLPLRVSAADSTSLVGSDLSTSSADAPGLSRYLLLGPRGGDQPIRLGLFAGFERREIASVRLITDLLLRLKESRPLTADFALLGYPVVNPRSFTDRALSLAEFEARFARQSADPVVNFYRDEFRRWTFHGLIHLRTRPGARTLQVTVRSETIAAEVVEPALAAVAPALPLDSRPVRVRPGDRFARTADFSEGRFGAPADVRPYPFEIELFLPEQARDGRTLEDGAFVVVSEILRNYRALLAHAPNL